MAKPGMFCILFIRLYDLKEDVYLLPVPLNSRSMTGSVHVRYLEGTLGLSLEPSMLTLIMTILFLQYHMSVSLWVGEVQHP